VDGLVLVSTLERVFPVFKPSLESFNDGIVVTEKARLIEAAFETISSGPGKVFAVVA